MEKNYYEILGIETDAQPTEIEMAFHNLDVRYHPAVEKDLSRKEKAAREKEFAAIKKAYETLSNPELKQQYDLLLVTELGNELADTAKNDDDKNEDLSFSEISTDTSANDEKTSSLANKETPLLTEVLKIFIPNISRPLIWLIIFIGCMFAINTFKDFSHKYTLVSEALVDTTYYTQTSDGKKERLLKKGEKVEILSNTVNGKTLETNLGKLPSKNLSTPQNGYIMHWWAQFYWALFPFLLVITLNLILLRIIITFRAIRVNKKYNQSHDTQLDKNDIIYCTKNEASVFKACLIIPFAYLITFFARKQLDAMALSYAFSSGDNSFINYILEHYQDKPLLFVTVIFIIFDIILGYFLILWSLRKYNCPYCHAPFSFFVIKTYDTDINTFNKTEYRSEQRNGRTVKVPYIVAYKNYNHHVIKQCNICEELQHKVYEKTDRI